MLRRLVIELILFAFPFILYFGSRAVARALKPEIVLSDYKRRMPVLIMAGAACAVLGFIIIWALEPRHRNETYVPARIEDGEFKPGGFTTEAPQREERALTPLQEAAKAREDAAKEQPLAK
jgi:hypothetical protein